MRTQRDDWLWLDKVINGATGGDPTETISSRMGRVIQRHKRCRLCRIMCFWLNRIEWHHCLQAATYHKGKKTLVALIYFLTFFLYGCSYEGIVAGYTSEKVQQRQVYNDHKASLLQALNCDVSLGAYARMPDGDMKRGLALICGVK